MRYQCHRRDRPEVHLGDESENNVSDDDSDDEVQRRPVQKKSKQVGCKARLNVVCYKVDPHYVHFEYQGEHVGHTPGSIEDVRFLPPSNELKERILVELQKRYSVRDVRLFLQQSYSHLGANKRDQYVSTTDVYNIYYKFWQQQCAKSSDDFESVEKWLNSFQQDGYHVWVDTADSERLLSPERFSFGFVAPWQKDLLLGQAGNFICLDATHNVSQYHDGILYTMVIRHPIAGRGVPVSYLLTDDKSSLPLLGWFRSLASLGLNPQRITIDHDYSEDNAISDVWPECTIQHCIWHVVRAWMKHIHLKVNTGNRAKKNVRERLRALMYEPDENTFQSLLGNFLAYLNRNHTDFASYFQRFWIDSFGGKAVNRWAACYQPEIYTNMQTNNYVESWHNQLKTVYLKRKRVHRLDMLLNVLTSDVAADIQAEVMRLSVNIGKMGSNEHALRKEEMKAENVRRELLPSMVQVISNAAYVVASFTGNHFTYNVTVS